VIHEHGITPDSTVSMSQEEEEALYLKRLIGGFESLDDDQKAKIQSVRDVQLERAQDYLKGILIHGDRVSMREQAEKQLASQRN